MSARTEDHDYLARGTMRSGRQRVVPASPQPQAGSSKLTTLVPGRDTIEALRSPGLVPTLLPARSAVVRKKINNKKRGDVGADPGTGKSASLSQSPSPALALALALHYLYIPLSLLCCFTLDFACFGRHEVAKPFQCTG